MNINVKRVKCNALFVESKLRVNDDRSQMVALEYTPTLLPCGIYKIALVEVSGERRRQLAIVASDADVGVGSHPHVIATIDSGNSFRDAKLRVRNHSSRNTKFARDLDCRYSNIILAGEEKTKRKELESKELENKELENKELENKKKENKNQENKEQENRKTDDYQVNARLLHDMGICFRSAVAFDKLFDRLEKCVKRGEEISLFIDDTLMQKTEVPHFWLEDPYHGCKAEDGIS